MKILVISLAGIGDTLFSTPLIHELRVSFPQATIDSVVLWPGARDLLQGNPYVNSIFQRNLLASNTFSSLRFLWSLRARAYDVSINTHPQSRIHYLAVARMINARKRISHSYHRSKWIDRALANALLPQDYFKHSVENNLDLLQFLGVARKLQNADCEVFFSADETTWANSFIQQHNLEKRIILGIHVGSGGTKNLGLRRWPLGNYLSLIQRINQKIPQVAPVLIGGPQEQSDHQLILARTSPGQVFVIQGVNIRKSAAFLKKCHSFLSVDSSMMHLAAAMKVPKQLVIETPTFNVPNHPHNQTFVLVPNPYVAGRNLQYYKYDGHDIRATRGELVRSMESVSVDSVYETVHNALVG